MKLRCKLRNIYSVIVEQKKLEGFDLIFTRIPEISLYQILLFIGASYTIIVSGQVQTGSVFLNAKPEQYRCRNKLDSFPDATYQNAHFASGKSNSTIKSKGCSKRRGLPQTVHELGTKNIAQNKDLPKGPVERTIRPKKQCRTESSVDPCSESEPSTKPSIVLCTLAHSFVSILYLLEHVLFIV